LAKGQRVKKDQNSNPLIYWQQTRTNDLNMASSTFVFPPNMATQNASCSSEKPFQQFVALFFFGHQEAKFHHKKKNPGPDHNRLYKFILISSILYIKATVSVSLSIRAVSRHCPDKQTDSYYPTDRRGLARAGGGTVGEGSGGGGQHGPRGGHWRGRTGRSGGHGRGEARRVHYAPGSH
jgi:hypothetical protein